MSEFDKYEKEIAAKIAEMEFNGSSKIASELVNYMKGILEWNEKINLTAITEDRDIIQKHFVDCVSIASKIDIPSGATVIDVGTGAGFPGIPVKIAFPDIEITLLDSLNKRINFLQEVVSSLGLENVNCVHSRAEDGGQNGEYREQYDMCISRAVANLAVLSEYCLPFVKVGGAFVSLKGPDVKEELEESKKALEKLGGEVIGVEKIDIPKSDITHSLVIIKKVRQTPKAYPRKAGKVTKNPIK